MSEEDPPVFTAGEVSPILAITIYLHPRTIGSSLSFGLTLKLGLGLGKELK